MPRHGSHIIQPWMTGAEKAYPEEQRPPTVGVPQFYLFDTCDCYFTNLTSPFDTDMANLWVDGHLAYFLTPQGMETYLCDRLRIQKRGERRPEVWVYGNMFLVNSRTLSESPPCPPYMYDTRGRPWFLIDYVFQHGSGFIVPQQLNMLNSPMPLKMKLNLPVFFHNRHGGLGVSVSAAAASATPGIRGEELVFEPIRPVCTTHLVLHWPGHHEFTKQTETRVSNSREPHTVGRFVHHIGLFMKKFLVIAPQPQSIADPRVAAEWPVDETWMRTLYIVGVVQVSLGRWQPILRTGH
ncbi:hypothetical protein PENSPDRAFT_748806 [Peniophora sp. CONT]|nr:hypothetical protein PENSPDRAFT_748806 [Peniophora sp. CONT]